MAGSVKNRATEHSGAKHGNGAYYGPKAIAKHYSNKERRRVSKSESQQRAEAVA